MAQQEDVLIVGAGLAGLLAARTLLERGIRPIVLEKTRHPGGRMATREIDGGLADIGAQFFTVRDPAFKARVDRWMEEGLVFEWSRGWSDGSLSYTGDGHPRYAVNGGMNALPAHLARGMDVRGSVNLVAVRRIDDHWEVEDENGTRQRTRAILLTPPVPHSLALLEEGNFPLPREQQQQLSSIDYEPCLTVTFHIDGEVTLPPPGVIQRPQAPIFWIADNQRKGLSPTVKLITMQAGRGYSRQLFDEPEEHILRAFRTDLLPFMAENAKIVKAELKRWLHSQPMSTYPDRCLVIEGGAPLVFAGDAFGAPRVEGAVLSGIAAGDTLANLLRR
jgi:renalase